MSGLTVGAALGQAIAGGVVPRSITVEAQLQPQRNDARLQIVSKTAVDW